MNNFSSEQWLELLYTLSRAVLSRSLSEIDDVNRPQFSSAIHAAGYLGFRVRVRRKSKLLSSAWASDFRLPTAPF